MKVLVLTQHYVPEVTACRFRAEAFVSGMLSRGHEVRVITPAPSHPEGVVRPPYEGRLRTRELVDGAAVSYLWTYVSPTKTAAHRLGYYASYAAMASIAGSLAARPDVVLATSPPLSVAAAGALVGARHRVPWVFDVRDLWPLAAEVMGELSNPRMIAAAEALERRLYRSADRIVVVTTAFEQHIRSLIDQPEKVTLIRNGTTGEWLRRGETEASRERLGLPSDRFLWTYAGNLGPSRRLDVAIEAARQLGDDFRLLIIGGGSSGEFERQAGELPNGQVAFTGLLEPGAAAEHLRASDALFVPQRRGLGDFVPSKLFDYAAIGRPLVVMADGETAELGRTSAAALTVEPEDVDGLVEAIRRLQTDRELSDRLGTAGRRFAAEHTREAQAGELVDLLERVAGLPVQPSPA